MGRPSLQAVLRLPIAFFTRPLVLAQALSSVAGGLTLVIGAAVLPPSQFTTFALLALLSNVAIGVGRASVFQPALIHQRQDPDAAVRARVSFVLCLLTAGATALVARTLGVPSWGQAGLIGAAALIPTAYDWLRYRAMGNDERWLIVMSDAVRLALVPVPLVATALAADAVALQVYVTASTVLPFVLLALTVSRPKSFAPYSDYARSAAWQLGDFAVGQFIVAVPLLVLGARATGGVVSGIRLAQALLGPLSLVVTASVSNLVADAATRDAFRGPRALVDEGSRLGRNITLTAISIVLVMTGAVALTRFELKGVENQDLVFGLLLVGGYTALTGWAGIHAIVLRLMDRQASVTLARAVIAFVTASGFVVAYVLVDADASVITGFVAATISSVVVFFTLSHYAYRRALATEPTSEPMPQAATPTLEKRPEQANDLP